MKPKNLFSKIFLDSGDPQETKDTLALLGWLDGQTTNPSLFAKNPEVVAKLKAGQKFSQQEIYASYKKAIQEISALIPAGSVSIEVYCDTNTTAEEMVKQAMEMNTWINNAHIKLPITHEGLKAAEILTIAGIRVNMTLCFSQNQGAAVYAATKAAKKGDVFLSPFIGRLDDINEDGMNFIENTLTMFKNGDGHAQTLAASVRTFDHLMRCLQLQTDIITVPAKVLKLWAEKNFILPDQTYQYNSKDLKKMPYEEINLNKNWEEYNIQHQLTDQGVTKFVADWNKLLK
ncbi:MAG: transaldolase family protein [Patescibacteria group bacterium]